MKKTKCGLSPEAFDFYGLVLKKLRGMQEKLSAKEKSKLLALGLTEEETKEIVDRGGRNINYQ